MKRLIVAKHAGFCMGVRIAVQKTLQIAEEKKGRPIYTYGELIHNPQAIKKLEEKGVGVSPPEKGLPSEGILILRTHGVTPDIYETATVKGLEIIDFTCPFVLKVQKIIDKYAKDDYTIMIIGDRGHSEVVGYLGWARGKGVVLDNISSLDDLSLPEKVCVVAQTTQDKQVFTEIIKRLKKMKKDIVVFDTICNATSLRQEEAVQITRIVEVMLVIGGKKSANTRRLVQICSAVGKPTFFIESPDEVPLLVDECSVVGLTAGASTPQDVIAEVVRILETRGFHAEFYNKSG